MVQLQINDGSTILDNLWQNLINTGARTRRHDSSHTGLLLSAIATELNVAITLLQSYANQFTLATATDRVLVENLASQYANRRLASKAKVILTFYRLEGYTESIQIPAGFAVRAAGSGNIIFKTVETVFLWKGIQSVSVLAYSLNSGAKYNVEANTLTIFANQEFNGRVAVTNLESAFGGYNDESISHLRERAQGFRYERDATLQDINRQLYEIGIGPHRYLAEEYIDGPGTYQICIDTDSESEFNDIIQKLDYRRHYGVKAVYVRATRMYIDMYITVDIAHTIDYNPTQKNTIYNNINDAIQKFFAAYCVVGADIRINALKAALNNALATFDVSNIDIDISNTVQVNEHNVIQVGNTQKAFPNKILTSLKYVGEL